MAEWGNLTQHQVIMRLLRYGRNNRTNDNKFRMIKTDTALIIVLYQSFKFNFKNQQAINQQQQTSNNQPKPLPYSTLYTSSNILHNY
jgi:hypothetical protein